MLYFTPVTGNTGSASLYVKVNDAKVVSQEDLATLPSDGNPWTQWNIDLSTLGTDLTRVTSLTIGVEGGGAQGVVHVDDVLLYKDAPEPPPQ